MLRSQELFKVCNTERKQWVVAQSIVAATREMTEHGGRFLQPHPPPPSSHRRNNSQNKEVPPDRWVEMNPIKATRLVHAFLHNYGCTSSGGIHPWEDAALFHNLARAMATAYATATAAATVAASTAAATVAATTTAASTVATAATIAATAATTATRNTNNSNIKGHSPKNVSQCRATLKSRAPPARNRRSRSSNGVSHGPEKDVRDINDVRQPAAALKTREITAPNPPSRPRKGVFLGRNDNDDVIQEKDTSAPGPSDFNFYHNVAGEKANPAPGQSSYSNLAREKANSVPGHGDSGEKDTSAPGQRDSNSNSNVVKEKDTSVPRPREFKIDLSRWECEEESEQPSRQKKRKRAHEFTKENKPKKKARGKSQATHGDRCKDIRGPFFSLLPEAMSFFFHFMSLNIPLLHQDTPFAAAQARKGCDESQRVVAFGSNNLEDTYPWTLLRAIPSLQRKGVPFDPSIFENTRPVMLQPTRTTCFFCGEVVKVPAKFTNWTLIESQHGYTELLSHCVSKHPAQRPCRLAPVEQPYKQGDPIYTVNDFIQSHFIKTYKEIPLSCFATLVWHQNPIPLIDEITLRMGAMQFSSQTRPTKKSPKKLDCLIPGVQYDWISFYCMADVQIQKIIQAFSKFDWLLLVSIYANPNSTQDDTYRAIVMLWNQTNLFFSIGLFAIDNANRFPPLIHKDMPNDEVPLMPECGLMQGIKVPVGASTSTSIDGMNDGMNNTGNSELIDVDAEINALSKKEEVILVFPFGAEPNIINAAAEGLTELYSPDSWQHLDTNVLHDEPQLFHNSTLDALRRGKWLRDTHIDFWCKW